MTSTTTTASGGRRVVVGIDGSAEAREALRWACRLAGLLRDEIVIVHALGLLESLDGELVAAHPHRAEIERIVAEEWCATLRRKESPFRIVVREGHPVDVLVDVAENEGADILVVGSRGLGATSALALGSTSLHVLQVAGCPVLVVPDPEEAARHFGLQRVLLAVNSVTPTVDAVGLAGELVGALGARVTVVHAVEEVPSFPLGPETRVSSEGETEAPERDRARFDPLRRRLQALGVPVDLRIERGPAPEVVRAVAAAIDADLVIVGSASASQSADPLVDSVSRQIAGVAHRPTLVVPEGWVRVQPGATLEVERPLGRRRG